MPEVAASPTAPAAPPKSRLMLGAAILAFAIFVKITGPVLIINSDLSAAWKTAFSVGLFIIVPKLLIITIIFVLGKAGFALPPSEWLTISICLNPLSAAASLMDSANARADCCAWEILLT